MTSSIVRPSHLRLGTLPLLLFLITSVTGCENVLEVSDPTALLEKDVNTPEGAERLRRNVFTAYTSLLFPAPAYYSGMLADEFRYELDPSSPIPTPNLYDRRKTEEFAGAHDDTFLYPFWQQIWGLKTQIAIEKLSAYALPGAREAHVGEMYAHRGFAALILAEHYCPGFPLHDVADYDIVRLSGPLSTAQALERALAAYDSAVSWAGDSARVLNFARVGRGRTLLDLGRFAEAGAAVVGVPTDYAFLSEQSSKVLNSDRESIANREGGVGLDFASSNDPRIPKTAMRTAFDGSTNYHPVAKRRWFVSGVEARLIEAEASLNANPGGTEWLNILNTLRTAGPNGSGGWTAGTGGVAGLPPLGDPGTANGRVDLLYRERAFWLFGTGTRLGDLRRLVRVYGRAVETVFPTGPYWVDGTYGFGTSIPFSKVEAQHDPGVTGCTSW